MWKKLALISTIAFQVLCVPFSVHADFNRAMVVEKVNIVVEGGGPASQVDAKSIHTRLRTKAGAPFSQEAFDEDLKNLIHDFDEVEPQVEFSDGQVVVTLKLRPRPMIGRITFRGNEKIDSATLEKEMELKTNEIFDRAAFFKAFNSLKSYYVKKGFFEAELSYDNILDTETNELELVIIVREGRSGRVGGIKFVGFTKEESNAVSSMIQTQKFNLFTSWLKGTGTYHKEAIEQDEFIILNYMQSRGFADARVDIRVREGSNNRLNILITLDRGRPYTFGRISFDGNTLFSDEEIQQRLAIAEGNPFSPDAIRLTVRGISELYGKQGYVDAYANYAPKLDPETDSYSVHFTIQEGPQYRVGMIKVFGNTTTHPEVILRESLLFPGDVFNVPKLQATEQRLRNIGYFGNVNVYAVKPDVCCGYENDFRDIHIEVEECSTGDFNFSFGFSTAESVFGSLTFTERNFCSAGIPKLWKCGYPALRGGGEFLTARLAIGAAQRSFRTSWTEPYFCCTPWSIGMDFDTVADLGGLKRMERYETGVAFHANYPINPFLRLSCHYRLKDTYNETDAKATPDTVAQAKLDGLLSAAGFALTYDSTNHPLMATQGFRSRFDFEFVGLGGPNHYFSFGYLNAYYVPLPFCSVLRFRGDMRFHCPVLGTDPEQIFTTERYYLGGETTVRGYEYNSLGPLKDDGDAWGGISAWLGSAEWLIPVISRADAFVFYDAGSIAREQFSLGNIQHAWGYGARLKLIDNGPPIIVGWGYPIDEKIDTIKKNFFVTFGGRF